MAAVEAAVEAAAAVAEVAEVATGEAAREQAIEQEDNRKRAESEEINKRVQEKMNEIKAREAAAAREHAREQTESINKRFQEKAEAEARKAEATKQEKEREYVLLPRLHMHACACPLHTCTASSINPPTRACHTHRLKFINDKIKIARVLARMKIRPVVLTFAAWKELVETNRELKQAIG